MKIFIIFFILVILFVCGCGAFRSNVEPDPVEIPIVEIPVVEVPVVENKTIYEALAEYNPVRNLRIAYGWSNDELRQIKFQAVDRGIPLVFKNNKMAEGEWEIEPMEYMTLLEFMTTMMTEEENEVINGFSI